MRMLTFDRVEPTATEATSAMPGDDVVDHADAVMDRAFTLSAPPSEVWPWLVQLGKRRGGWYLPHRLERLMPRTRRAIRHLDPQWQHLRVGDVIPDYGGRHATFTVHAVVQKSVLVYTSRRGRMDVSWAIRLTAAEHEQTRVHLRLRLGPIRRKWLADTAGQFLDVLTIAGLAAGLDERVTRRDKRR